MLICSLRVSSMIKLNHPPLVRQCCLGVCMRPRRTLRIGVAHQALPVKIIRVTVEKMIKRIIHISQPNHFWYGGHGGYTDTYCVGVDDGDDGVVLIAVTCIVLILVLYTLLVILRKYEKEHDKF